METVVENLLPIGAFCQGVEDWNKVQDSQLLSWERIEQGRRADPNHVLRVATRDSLAPEIDNT